MPVRRERVKQAMDAVIASRLEPGETIQAEVLCLKGPNPWLTAGILGLIGWLLTKYYYVVVTEKRVLFERSTFWWGNRPKGLESTDPRSSVSLIEHKPGNVWGHFTIKRADGSEWKLWVHRFWRDDGDKVAQVLGQTAPAAGGAQGVSS
ncbi:MAG: hypothetical protein ABR600_11930 [Actinomycetota bacterium]|nr:hypothetical protein [Actinomycetota bacterium]